MGKGLGSRDLGIQVGTWWGGAGLRLGRRAEAAASTPRGGEQRCARKLTRDTDVREHCLLAVLDAADLREVGIQSQVEKAAEEGEDAHGNAIVAGVAVAVENAVLLRIVHAVHVPFIDDGAKHHDGEHLEGEGGGRHIRASPLWTRSCKRGRPPPASLQSHSLAWTVALGSCILFQRISSK